MPGISSLTRLPPSTHVDNATWSSSSAPPNSSRISLSDIHHLLFYHSSSPTALGPPRTSLPPRRILQQPLVHPRRIQIHISHDAAPDEDIAYRRQVRVLRFVEHGDVVEFDVEVLVAGLEGAADEEVVFELDGEGGVG